MYAIRVNKSTKVNQVSSRTQLVRSDSNLVDFFIGDTMKRIPLTQGKFAIVDDRDYEWLNQWKWYANRDRNTFYAVRNIKKKNGKQATIRMHRLILGSKKGQQTDHLNGNGLNNMRKNIRICTYAQNQWNQHRDKPTIGGIWWDKERRKFRVVMRHNGKKKYLGQYKEKSEAIKAYQIATKQRLTKYLNNGGKP